MFEVIQLLVSSKKLEDGFGMDNVEMVNGRGKLQDYVVTILDLIFNFSKIILHVYYTTCWTAAIGSKWMELMISDCLLMF